MTYAVVCLVAFIASVLTFFSGFGLGTLLLPVFALFFPIETAVASTAVVHFLNGLFKAGLVGRRADPGVVLRFGLPAIAAAFAGAWLLLALAGSRTIATWTVGNFVAEVTALKIVIGLLLLTFAILELTPWFARLAFPPRLMPVGGLLSGFLGGVSGLQGALRSAFLVKAGLSKEAFIGTGVVIAVLVDVARLTVYARLYSQQRDQIPIGVVAAGVIAALIGSIIGNSLLAKVTLDSVRTVVAVMLALVAVALIAGVA